MTYKWINTQKIQGIEGKNIITFGVGEGAIEFLSYQKENCSDVNVTAIADNDSSFWGKTLIGYDIISPGQINAYCFDKIVVTSISGVIPLMFSSKIWALNILKTIFLSAGTLVGMLKTSSCFIAL
jgi:hypothetical protein